MNTTSDLEKRLRSWTPRGPSARIERRLFRRNLPEPYPRLFHPSWLVPAAAACLLFLTVVRPPGDAGFAPFSGPMAAVILSNQPAAAYLATAYKPQANSVPAESFEWTNDGTLTSSMSSISTRKGSYDNK